MVLPIHHISVIRHGMLENEIVHRLIVVKVSQDSSWVQVATRAIF